MLILESYILLFILYLILFFLTKKLNFLQSEYFSKHQKLIGSESIPQIGGLIFFIFIVINFSDFNYYLILFSFFILALGIFSDLTYLASPNKRLLLQCLIGQMAIFSFLNSLNHTFFLSPLVILFSNL